MGHYVTAKKMRHVYSCVEVTAKGSRLIDATSFLHIFDLNSHPARSRSVAIEDESFHEPLLPRLLTVRHHSRILLSKRKNSRKSREKYFGKSNSNRRIGIMIRKFLDANVKRGLFRC